MITLKSFERSPHLAELKVSYKRRRKVEAGQLAMPWIIASATTADGLLPVYWSTRNGTCILHGSDTKSVSLGGWPCSPRSHSSLNSRGVW